jgi:hypothetical protein
MRERPSRIRVVGYRIECEVSLEMEILLERGKLAGTVTEGDCGSDMIWFEGRPGPELRAFRTAMAVLSKSKPLPAGSPGIERLVRKFVRVQSARRSLGR